MKHSNTDQKEKSGTHSISIQWVNIITCTWSQIFLCLLMYLKNSERPVYNITTWHMFFFLHLQEGLECYVKNDWCQIGTHDWHWYVSIHWKMNERWISYLANRYARVNNEHMNSHSGWAMSQYLPQEVLNSWVKVR